MKSDSVLLKRSYKRMTLKSTLLVFTALFLSACGTSKYAPNLEAYSFYLINPQTAAYCKGYDADDKRKHCKSLVPTNFAHLETRVIENIYQQQVTEPNRILSLTNIILKGDNIDYTPVALANGFYKLPINQQTDTVWDVLVKIQNPKAGSDD